MQGLASLKLSAFGLRLTFQRSGKKKKGKEKEVGEGVSLQLDAGKLKLLLYLENLTRGKIIKLFQQKNFIQSKSKR